MKYRGNIPLEQILKNIRNEQSATRPNRYNRKNPYAEDYVAADRVRAIVGTALGSIIVTILVLTWVAFRIMSNSDITYSAPIQIKSEMTKEQIKALNIMPIKPEKHHG